MNDEKHNCNTCKYGHFYDEGYDITMMDDECGGCSESNDKWQPIEEQEHE